jgi:hypothetical protein
VGWTLVAFLPDGETLLAGDLLSADKIAHEVIHAAGSYAVVVGRETDVPGGCSDHASAERLYQQEGDDRCREKQSQIYEEWRAWFTRTQARGSGGHPRKDQ